MKTVSENQSSGNIKNAAMPLLTGVLSAFILSIVMLMIFSLVMTLNDLPTGVVQLFACISIGIGALAGGFMSSRLYRNNGLILGVITGLMFFAILLITGVITHQVGFNAYLLIKFALTLVCGGAGGITGVNLRRKRSRI